MLVWILDLVPYVRWVCVWFSFLLWGLFLSPQKPDANSQVAFWPLSLDKYSVCGVILLKHIFNWIICPRKFSGSLKQKVKRARISYDSPPTPPPPIKQKVYNCQSHIELVQTAVLHCIWLAVHLSYLQHSFNGLSFLVQDVTKHNIM